VVCSEYITAYIQGLYNTVRVLGGGRCVRRDTAIRNAHKEDGRALTTGKRPRVPRPEVGKVTLKSNGDEALSDEFLLKNNGDEALHDGFP
jgi:hypothetical protein